MPSYADDFFKNLKTDFAPAAPAEPEQDPNASTGLAGDIGREVGIGLNQLARAGGLGLRKLGAERLGGAIETAAQERTQELQSQLTPEQQAADQRSLFDDGFSGRKLVGTLAQSAPSMVAGLGVGGLVTRGLLAAGVRTGVAGIAGAGAGEGAVAGAVNASDLYDRVKALPTETLSRNQDYQSYRAEAPQDADADEYAREKLATNLALKAGGATALTTAVLGAPAGVGFARILQGEAGKTAVRTVAKQALLESLQEGPQSAAETIISGELLATIDPELRATPREILESGIEGAIAGAALGGPFAGAGIGLSRLDERGQAKSLGVDVTTLRGRKQGLREQQQADPEFKPSAADVVDFLAARKDLIDGQFVERPAPAEAETETPQEPVAPPQAEVQPDPAPAQEPDTTQPSGDDLQQTVFDNLARGRTAAAAREQQRFQFLQENRQKIDEITTKLAQDQELTADEQGLYQEFQGRIDPAVRRQKASLPAQEAADALRQEQVQDVLQDDGRLPEQETDRDAAPAVSEARAETSDAPRAGAQVRPQEQAVTPEPVQELVPEPTSPAVNAPELPRLKRGYTREAFRVDEPSFRDNVFFEDTSTKGKKTVYIQKKDGQVIPASKYILDRLEKKARTSVDIKFSRGEDGSLLQGRGLPGVPDNGVAGEAAQSKLLDQRVASFAEAVRNQTGYTAKQWSLRPSRTAPSKNLVQLANVFGKDVALVSHRGVNLFEGASDGGSTIFISDSTKAPHLIVFGHELTHVMKVDHPDLYESVASLIRDLPRTQDTESAYPGFSPEDQLEEDVAEYIGRNMTRQEFWDQVINTDPTLFERLKNLVRQLVDAVRGTSPGAWVKDFQRAEMAAANALAEYSRRQTEGLTTEQIKFRKDLDTASKQGIEKVRRGLKGALSGQRLLTEHLSKILKVTPLPTLVELGSERVPQLKEFAKGIRRWRTIQGAIVSDSGVLADEFTKLAKKGVGVDALHKVMAQGTFYQVNPWESELEQPWVPKKGSDAERLEAAQKNWADAGMQTTTGKSFREAYREASEGYQNLKDPQLQDAYLRVLEDIKNIRSREYAAMQAVIEELTANDPEQRKFLLDQLRQKFSTVRGAYMPLARFGRFTIRYTDSDGVPGFKLAESAREQEEAVAAIESLGGTIVGIDVQEEQQRSLAAIPSEFLDQIQGAINRDYTEGIDPADTETLSEAQADAAELLQEINQIFLRWTPETSALKNSLQRKNVRGFSENMTRGYLDYMQRHASNVAYFEEGRKIDKLFRDTKDAIKEKNQAGQVDIRVERGIYNDMRARRAAMKTVTAGKLASFLGRMSTFWYLTSPSIALVQMSQLGVLTLPQLSTMTIGKTPVGLGKATAALGNATHKALSTRYARKAMFGDPDVNLIYQDMQAKVTPQNRNTDQAKNKNLGDDLFSRQEIESRIKKLTPYQQELLALHEAMARGVLDISLAHEVYQLVRGEDPTATMPKVAKAMMVFMRHSELASRKAAILGSFNLAQKQGLGFFDSMDVAEKVADDTLFDYSPEAKGVLLQGGAARVLLAFQHFRIMTHMKLGLLVRNMVKGESPAVKRQAYKEFVGIMGMAALLGGATALPIGWLWPLLDTIFGDDDEPFSSELEFTNILNETLGETAGAAAKSGLPTLLGANISRRVGLQNIGWTDLSPPEYLHGDGLAAWLAQQALGPAYSVPAGFIRGYDDIMNRGDYFRGMESALPKPFKDISKTLRIASEGVKNRAGKRMLEGDLRPDELLMMALGFSPESVFAAGERSRKLSGLSTRISERRGRLVRNVLEGYNSGDPQDAIDAVVEFNKKMPAFAITGSDLRGGFTAMKKGDLMIPGRREFLVEQKYGQ